MTYSAPDRIHVEVRGSGASWGVFVDGRQVGGSTNAFDKACIKANALQVRLARMPRHCLRCAAPFMAAGRHNRLCPTCNSFARAAMI
jgi:Zn finger protein HypA/HybF involved in hydrogenase expression